jgi:hypothetical protein
MIRSHVGSMAPEITGLVRLGGSRSGSARRNLAQKKQSRFRE